MSRGGALWTRGVRSVHWLLRLCAALSLTTLAYAQGLEYEVKAAFLLNFAKFVEWSSEPQSDQPFSLCLYGSNPFGDVLTALQEKKVHGRSLKVSVQKKDSSFAGCWIVFVPVESIDSVPSIQSRIAAAGGVLITDGPSSGVIGFVVDDGKIRFDINLREAKAARVAVSSQLLKLAREVVPEVD